MPVFSYKALGPNGAVTSGEIDATDRPEALKVLDRRGLQPVALRESAKALPQATRNGKRKEAAATTTSTSTSSTSSTTTTATAGPAPLGPPDDQGRADGL